MHSAEKHANAKARMPVIQWRGVGRVDTGLDCIFFVARILLMSVDMRWNAVLHTPFIFGSSPGGQTSSYNGSVEEGMFQRQVTEQIVPAVYASIGSASTLTSKARLKALPARCKVNIADGWR